MNNKSVYPMSFELMISFFTLFLYWCYMCKNIGESAADFCSCTAVRNMWSFLFSLFGIFWVLPKCHSYKAVDVGGFNVIVDLKPRMLSHNALCG